MRENDERAVSPVIAGILMIAIVVVLGAAAGMFLTGIGQESDLSPASQVAVNFEQQDDGVLLESQAAVKRGSVLQLKVNGEVAKTWEKFGAGRTKELQCLTPGDRIAVVSKKKGEGNANVVEKYEVKRKTDCTFGLNLGGSTYNVTPVGWNSASGGKDFYSYGGQDGTGHPHTHMPVDFVEPDTTYVFLYEYNDKLSLMVVNDQPDKHSGHCSLDVVDGCWYNQTDSDGGSVDMTYSGFPSAGDWVVKDDPGDDDYASPITWGWYYKHTDGGVFAGGFSGDISNINMEMTITLNSGNTDLKWVAGNRTKIDLTSGSQIKINGTDPTP